MAGISAGVAGRMASVMAADVSCANLPGCRNKKTPGLKPGRSLQSLRWRLAAIAEEAQQEQEQVDEVEIERESAHHCLAAGDSAVIVHAVHFLDLLGVPGGQAREDQHADRGDREIKPAALEEHVDDHRQDEAEQSHC